MSIFNNNHENVVVCKDEAQQKTIFGLSNLVSHNSLVNVKWVYNKTAQNPSKDSDVKVFSAEYVIFKLRARYYAQQTVDALAVSTIALGALSMLMLRSARRYYSKAYNTLSEAFNFDQSAEKYLEVLQDNKAYRGILIGFLPLYLVGYVVSHIFTALWKGLKAVYDKWQSAKPSPTTDIWPTLKCFCGQLYNDLKELFAPTEITNKSLYDYFNSAVVHILWYLVAIPTAIVQSCLIAFVTNDLANFIEYMKSITEVCKGHHGYGLPQGYISHDYDKPKFTISPMILLVLPIYYVLQPVKWITSGLGWICHINIDVGTQISFLINHINFIQGALYGCLEAPFSYLAARTLKKNIVLNSNQNEMDELFSEKYVSLFKRPIVEQDIFTRMHDQDRGCLFMLTPINKLALPHFTKENKSERKANDFKNAQFEPMSSCTSSSNLFRRNNSKYTLTSSNEFAHVI